ncbi:hypothetical protein F4861DRAFT_36687 [Xylaria intraflava]|nr:hypothetical protein F4861DRAFT_36687 [Xylaria intraflava]
MLYDFEAGVYKSRRRRRPGGYLLCRSRPQASTGNQQSNAETEETKKKNMAWFQERTVILLPILAVSALLEWVFGIHVPLSTTTLVLLVTQLTPVYVLYIPFYVSEFILRRRTPTLEDLRTAVRSLVTAFVDLFLRDEYVDTPILLWIVRFWAGFAVGLWWGCPPWLQDVILGILGLRDDDQDLDQDQDQDEEQPQDENVEGDNPDADNRDGDGRLRREIDYWVSMLPVWIRIVTVLGFFYAPYFVAPRPCDDCDEVIASLEGVGHRPSRYRFLLDGSITREGA